MSNNPRRPCAHCGRTLSVVGRGLCGRCYADPEIKSAMTCRRSCSFTAKQREYVRANWGRQTHAEIGAAIGRTAAHVGSFGQRIGLPRLCRRGHTETHRRAITAFAVKGKSAATIGAIVGVSASAVCQALRRWGIQVPKDVHERNRVAAIRAGLRRYAKGQSMRSWGEALRARLVGQSIALGWPFAGTPARARVCAIVQSAGRPVSAPDIIAAMAGGHGRRLRTVKSVHTIAARMCREGLLVRVKRGRYVIGPAATGGRAA